MDAVKRAATQHSRDRAVTDAEGLQLPGGDEPELAPCNPSDCATWVLRAAGGVQKVTEFRRRDEVGDVRTMRASFSPRPISRVDLGQFRTGCAAHLAEDAPRMRRSGRDKRDCDDVDTRRYTFGESPRTRWAPYPTPTRYRP